MGAELESIKRYEVVLGPKLKVTKDEKSGTRVVTFPFEFPDGERGVLIVCRIENEEWVPVHDITSIVINFK